MRTKIEYNGKTIAFTKGKKISINCEETKPVTDITVQVGDELQEKSVSPTTSAQEISADVGYDGLSKVTVEAVSVEQKSITANGTYTPPPNKYFDSVTVNVPDVPDSPLPIEIETSDAMAAFLENAEIGSVCKYTGPTETYESGALYVIEESE